MNLVQSAQAEAEKSTRAALRAYGALLVQSNQPADDDGKAAKRLKALIEQLGKTPAEVETDLRLVQQAAQLRKHIEAGAGGKERAAIARRELAAYDAETGRIIDARRKGYSALYEKQRATEKVHGDASIAASELERLLAFHPDLLVAGIE